MKRKLIHWKKEHFPDSHKRILNKYRKDNAENKNRIEYALNENSIVFDLGGYKGEWAERIYNKYQCYIYIFEPVAQFYNIIKSKFEQNPKIKVFHLGLGHIDTKQNIFLDNDSSSLFSNKTDLSKTKIEEINLVDAHQWLSTNQISQIDLIKINIEGAEYDLINHLIKNRSIHQIRNLQVQFHDFVENASQKYLQTASMLRKTHKLTWQYPFVWENWEIKSK